MAQQKLIINDKIYVPSSAILDVKAVEQKYTHVFFDDGVCNGCENRYDRPNEACFNCEYGGMEDCVRLMDSKRIGGKQYYSFPIGSREKLPYYADIDYDDFKIVDKRAKHEFRYPVKMKVDLRDYQVPACRTLEAKKFGILCSPPRSGKTLMGSYTMVQHGYRTIILADQKDFLDGFYETLEEFSNLPELEKKAGHKLFGFLDKDEHFEQYEIGLCTYQKFLHQTERRMKMLNDNFGSLLIDEVHKSASNCFTKVVNQCRQTIKCGLSATPTRKDGRHSILFQVVGPIASKVTIKSLRPSLRIHDLPFVTTRAKYAGKAGWARMINFLSDHKKRNENIIQWLKYDLEMGRNIVVPVERVEHAKLIAKELNEWADPSGNRPPIAEVFVGGAKEKHKRKQIVDRARSGQTRVVIGTKSLLRLGINVPRWDTLYSVLPSSNRENWEQESARVLTPNPDMPNKKPIVRMFVDSNIGQTVGCFKKTLGFSLDLSHRLPSNSRRKAAKLGFKEAGGNDSTPLPRNSMFSDPTGGDSTSIGRNFL